MYRSLIALNKVAHQMWHKHTFSQRSKTAERVVGGGGGKRQQERKGLHKTWKRGVFIGDRIPLPTMFIMIVMSIISIYLCIYLPVISLRFEICKSKWKNNQTEPLLYLRFCYVFFTKTYFLIYSSSGNSKSFEFLYSKLNGVTPFVVLFCISQYPWYYK